MNNRLYVAIGQIMLPDYKDTDESYEECLNAGKLAWDIYTGKTSAEQIPRDIADKITLYTYDGHADKTTLDRAYANLIRQYRKRDFVLWFMLDACEKILLKFNYTRDKIHALFKGTDAEKHVQILLDAVHSAFQNRVPSLTKLAAKVVADNKHKLVTDISNSKLPDCLFFSFPDIEINEERFLKHKLIAFLDAYDADALEIKVTSYVLRLLSSKNKLQETIQDLFEFLEKGSAFYSAPMLKTLYSPLMDAAQRAAKGEINEEGFHVHVKYIIEAYKPETTEGMHIQRLLVVLKSITIYRDLHALLNDKALRSKSSASLATKLRAPLIEMVKAYNQFVKERRYDFAPVKPK